MSITEPTVVWVLSRERTDGKTVEILGVYSTNQHAQDAYSRLKAEAFLPADDKSGYVMTSFVIDR